MDSLITKAKARFGGIFGADCWRVVETGLALPSYTPISLVWSKRRGRFEQRYLVWETGFHNVWTDEGLDSILDVYFHAATQITTWYCLLFETDTTPDGDTTYAVPVFTECTSYDEATRPEYEEAASSSQSVTNSANKAAFTISATKTLYGAAVVGGGTDGNTKGDAAGGGTMPVAGKFGSSRGVLDDDVVNLTYTVGAADDGA